MPRLPTILPTIFKAMCIALPLCACDPLGAPPPKTTTLVFDVQGMHCNGCVTAIDAEVREIAGVSGAQVSLEEHTARVEVTDPALEAKVEAAIRSLGYTVKAMPAPQP